MAKRKRWAAAPDHVVTEKEAKRVLRVLLKSAMNKGRWRESTLRTLVRLAATQKRGQK